MAVNYDDERFQQVNAEKEQALNNVKNTYGNMINESDSYYQNQMDAVNQYGETQKQLQQEKTDLAIDKIEQEKEWARQDYLKEQKGAYSDYQKQSDQYGALAENMASQGMSNTGYSETTLRDVYNTYQNRIATARDSFNKAVVNYDMGIKEAQLSNNSLLAEISYNTLKESLELSLQGFQYKNSLLKEQLQMENETEDRYYSRWKDVLEQINTENALEEQKRQFNLSLANSGSGGYDFGESGGEYINTTQDAKTYGTFSNGYQPKGISGHGLLSQTGRVAQAGNGKNQNVWVAEDGTYWFWDGDTRVYVPFANFYNTTAKGTTTSTPKGKTVSKGSNFSTKDLIPMNSPTNTKMYF
mgnify:CR=1 FL=1